MKRYAKSRYMVLLVMVISGCVGSQSVRPNQALETSTYFEQTLKQIVVLKIDPQQYEFRAHYSDPQSLSEWIETVPDAVALVNANFFDPNYHILGLLIASDVLYGQSYQDRGGTFAIHEGIPQIRSNVHNPYRGEPFTEAVQGFPMLVRGGEQTYFSDGRIARRTAIALDQDGNVLLITTPLIGLSLKELSQFLATSDLNVVDAFNLDGGGSTMLLSPDYRLASIDRVPAILAVYPRTG